jgi:hypothetical protein
MFMLKSVKSRGLALLATVALLGGTAWVATATTGAYFSDTHTGAISGTIGSIRVTPSGGTGGQSMDLQFSNMLPGVAQTVTVNYTNTGANTQDVWIVFNNATALSALNNLGHYGEASLSANGTALFHSTNLNDRVETCGPFSPSGCWPLKSQYKVASNLAPGASGTASFTFNYDGVKTVTPPTAFNVFPASTQGYTVTHNKDDQYVVNTADGHGSGLPYSIVATQHGVTP